MLNILKKIWIFLNEKHFEGIGLFSTDFLYQLILDLISFFKEIMLTTPTKFLTTEGFSDIYGKVLLLSIIVLAIIWMRVILIKIGVFSNDYEVSFPELIWRSLVYAIMSRTAPHLMILIIGFFNKIVIRIIDAQNIIIPNISDVGSGLAYSLLLIFYAIMIVRLILFYFERMGLLIFYTLIIPITLAFRISNKYSNMTSKLSEKIRDLLMIKVAHALVLLIIGAVIISVENLEPLTSLGFQAGILLATKKIEAAVLDLLNACIKIPSYQESIRKYRRGYSDIKNVGGKVISFIKRKFLF